jgi:hypothetical protein
MFLDGIQVAIHILAPNFFVEFFFIRKSGLISPLGWQLEEGYMRRFTAAWN